jgi:hypothetical protein
MPVCCPIYAKQPVYIAKNKLPKITAIMNCDKFNPNPK